MSQLHPGDLHLSDRLKQFVAAAVCGALICPTAPLAAQSFGGPSASHPASSKKATESARKPYRSNQLSGDDRILHALNRFTFGPRPGDLEAARAMGLDNWFNQQLHPSTLDQTDLQTRLEKYPAMQEDPQLILYRLPSNAIIRQVADGKAPMPQNVALKAIYSDELARVEQRRQDKALKNQQQAAAVNNSAAPGANQAMNAGTSMDAAKNSIAPAASASGAAASGDGNQMNMAGDMATAAVPGPPPFDPALAARILAMPPNQRISELVSMDQQGFDSFRKGLRGPQRAALLADLTPLQKEYVAALENPERVVTEELFAQRLTRDIYSSAQLQEVMTDFWMNHFNVYLRKNEATPYYLVSYERDVIRPRALGKFEDLLEATAHSPAMMIYLDNANSIGPDSPVAERGKMAAARNPDKKKKAPEGLNENYARELMELHTLGVNGGYTQADVTQVARVLTGWGVDRPQRGGGFKFDESRHEPGAKKVLGKKIKENGEKEGEELMHMLASNPATARFLSRKLAIRFVGDDPPQALIDSMAKSYMTSGGDISAVLKTLFHSPEFWDSTAYRAKVKTPLEFVVSAARAGNATTNEILPLANALRDMGMPLYGAVPPTGYNWQAETWVSTGALVNRMNFALSLAANRLPGVSLSLAPPPDTISSTQLGQDDSGAPVVLHTALSTTTGGPGVAPIGEELRLESILVPGGVSESTRAAVLQQFEVQIAAGNIQQAPQVAKPVSATQAANNLDKQDQVLAGLLLGSPEFQRR
jgi:uncharacterized protein (DUF1800 family)